RPSTFLLLTWCDCSPNLVKKVLPQAWHHLLGFVDDQHGADERAVDVVLSTLPQHLAAGPSVVGAQLYPEQRPELPEEVVDRRLWAGEHAHGDVALCGKPLGEDAQRHRLAGSGRAGDQRKPAFAGELLDAPAEGLTARGDVQGLDGHVGGERVPL